MTKSSSEFLPVWLSGRLGLELRDVRLRLLTVMSLIGPARDLTGGRERAEIRQAIDHLDEAIRLMEEYEVTQ